ncbi:uncharacterized protein ACH125_003023 isoform 1-T1 [Urocitellus parryii]
MKNHQRRRLSEAQTWEEVVTWKAVVNADMGRSGHVETWRYKEVAKPSFLKNSECENVPSSVFKTPLPHPWTARCRPTFVSQMLSAILQVLPILLCPSLQTTLASRQLDTLLMLPYATKN